MKHTPGPWHVADEPDRNEQAIVRAEHIEIATCWHHSVGAIEKEMWANARLIAAAPELLEALLRLTGMIRDCHNVYQNHSASWMLKQESFSLAEAVISKARGTEPPPRG